MFYSKDYIVRMAEQIGLVLARILKIVLHDEDVDLDEADSQIQEAADKAGIDMVLVRTIVPQSLLHMVSVAGSLDVTRASLLAELLFVSAHLEAARSNHDVALELFGRALTVYQGLEGADYPHPGLPDAEHRIADIEERLGPDPDPPAAD